jgi:TatA/E family protein of Tat protein translocase
MLDIGIQELLVIMVLALLIFGPDKLPELGRRFGRAMREFRRASDEFRSTVEQNLQIHDQDISPPTPSPLEPQASSVASATAATDTTADGATVAPAVDGATPAAGSPEVDDLLEPYWTSRGGRLLHRRDCAWRRRVPASERIPVKTTGEGWDQGLQPCQACDPKEVAVAS